MAGLITLNYARIVFARKQKAIEKALTTREVNIVARKTLKKLSDKEKVVRKNDASKNMKQYKEQMKVYKESIANREKPQRVMQEDK